MKPGTIILVVVVVVAVLALAIWYATGGWTGVQNNATSTANSTSTATTTPNPQNETLTLAGGQIAVSYPADFGLAVTSTQVQVHSYIPPCDQDFDYCLYYNGSAYQGTNFESAGIRISQRADLKTETACAKTVPAGYTRMTPALYNGSGYTTSAFGPLGDAAAGHYANGTLYRLFFGNNTCYEFETRIGETQFANYPAGTISQFTDAERSDLISRLRSIIDSTSLNAASVIFPSAPTSTQP